VAVSVAGWPSKAGLGEAVSVVLVVTVAAVTVSVSAVDVEPANPALPEYTAVMLNVPTGRLLVVKAAMPEELTVVAPSDVVPL
jgi:hypothetical protein